ncbi:hypothetical protein AJ80_06225 [Polytolypa hystricis UAMH7299]|uniref:NmrA-like domain-containing protein n=1 Tax=Polytolypa hystricis (strain UAMH7299) TaxID=1447883 RepID=A0A2B7XXG9_POLH7|nr:hypothetical protein AJ80_06225 [Polytolypa hystricis UAMH7299]
MQKKILVVGATGQQGRAFIQAILRSSASSPATDCAYHVLALTRNPQGPPAQRLSKLDNVTVVKGDLDNHESIEWIFKDAQNAENGQRIWGVLSILAFPGLGMNADGEERQGKMLADLALKYKASAFIYSSALLAGRRDKNELMASYSAKTHIEKHIRLLGEKELPWCIVRPGFFMENFDGFISSIGVGVFKSALNPDIKLALIASEDIGEVIAGIFKNFPTFQSQFVAVTSESLTMQQIEATYQRALSRPMPSIPSPLAWVLPKINSGVKGLISNLEQYHELVVEKKAYPELEHEIELARSVYPDMKTFYDWALAIDERENKKRQEDEEERHAGSGGHGDWNRVSLWKMITGQM